MAKEDKVDEEEDFDEDEESEESKKEHAAAAVNEKGVINSEITEEMQKAYINYAMSVIVSRALPAVEDGLKPVHRRILYAMDLLGLKPNSQTKKSARIVGDVMGKLHPHGDMAIYDSLVRMAQDFSLRYPLVIGQGNFGSVDNDPPAASRYTEAKLSSPAMDLLEDLDKDTVKMVPNFDSTLDEPELLPGKLPNLLINGSSGIAVGMATNIPPHNLTEICDATIRYIDNPDVTIEKLLEVVSGPDFPTGGSASGNMQEIYSTGRGRVTLRAKVGTETKKGKERIIITEIPYMVNKADLVSQVALLAQEKKLTEISDIRDESAKGKIRVVIDLKRGVDSKFVINKLYKFTRLQDSFDVNLLALVKGKPVTLDLKRALVEYVRHRTDVVERRTKFDLKKAEDRLEIVQGLIIALKDIDDVITLIKRADNSTDAKEKLVHKYKLSIRQAEAILEIRLAALTHLEQDKLKKEGEELEIKIKDLKKILSSKQEILSVIRKELLDIKKRHGDERKTRVMVGAIKELEEKDLIQKKEVVVTITDKGYAKRMDMQTYKEQKRGGKGIIGSDLSTGDFVKQLMTCSTHDFLLFFTSKGRVYWLKAHDIPASERYSKGKALINLLNLKEEKVASVMAVKEFDGEILLVTSNGIIKKMPLKMFSKPRSSGVRVMNFPTDTQDELIDVKPIKEKEQILLITKKGQAIRFENSEVRSMGRAAYGVTGIKLDKSDRVMSLEIIPQDNKDTSIMTITERGYGKRSLVEDYRLTGRAGKGVINLKVTHDKTGNVVTSISVSEKDKFIVTTEKGMVIKSNVHELRIMSRATQGVRIVKLQDADKVSDLIKVIDEIEEETEKKE
ncbi:MAG: DNA gyrase subunit A [Nanoarchaeota archaeon]